MCGATKQWSTTNLYPHRTFLTVQLVLDTDYVNKNLKALQVTFH